VAAFSVKAAVEDGENSFGVEPALDRPVRRLGGEQVPMGFVEPDGCDGFVADEHAVEDGRVEAADFVLGFKSS